MLLTVVEGAVGREGARRRSPTASRANGRASSCSAAAAEGRVALVAAVDAALVERGVKAGDIVKTAAQVVGGGGGGRDTMAQAGGKDPSKLPEALDAARERDRGRARSA